MTTGTPTRLELLESRTLLAQAAGWSETIDNPWFPLLPGSTYVYSGLKDGEAQVDRVIVTDATKQILGVTITVVLDRVFVDGELVEKTYDWYAQDLAGNLWYFGEDSRDIENGKVVSREGSWEAGVNGARPGIIMKAQPAEGDGYYQEFAPGIAEDQASVLSLHASAETPFATFKNCLQTLDFTPLEPTLAEHKFYAPGIGWVKSQAISGDVEILKLVEYLA